MYWWCRCDGLSGGQSGTSRVFFVILSVGWEKGSYPPPTPRLTARVNLGGLGGGRRLGGGCRQPFAPSLRWCAWVGLDAYPTAVHPPPPLWENGGSSPLT